MCSGINNNFIIETLKRIDKTQKEACMENLDCSPCEKSLIAKKFDTIPVSIFLQGGIPFEAFLEPEGCKTSLLRIESIRDNRFATFSLIEVFEKNEKTKYRCTEMTVIVDLACLCCLQCFDPIKCNCN